MQKLDDDFSSFSSFESFISNLSWECLNYLEADTPQTLLEASEFTAPLQ